MRVSAVGLCGWLLCVRCGRTLFVVGVIGVVGGVAGAWLLVVRVCVFRGVLPLARLGLGAVWGGVPRLFGVSVLVCPRAVWCSLSFWSEVFWGCCAAGLGRSLCLLGGNDCGFVYGMVLCCPWSVLVWVLAVLLLLVLGPVLVRFRWGSSSGSEGTWAVTG